MPRFWNSALLAAALLAPVAIAPAAFAADDHNNRSYHDKQHNDDHQWNDHENLAYVKWTKETHRKNTPFAKLKDDDQQSYWGWRHEHSDALLKIEIR
jgi:Spy/CpxP family protein refolding chaperone